MKFLKESHTQETYILNDSEKQQFLLNDLDTDDDYMFNHLNDEWFITFDKTKDPYNDIDNDYPVILYVNGEFWDAYSFDFIKILFKDAKINTRKSISFEKHSFKYIHICSLVLGSIHTVIFCLVCNKDYILSISIFRNCVRI